MGARLQYVKVVDKQHFYVGGGRVHPGLVNEVFVNTEPGVVGVFLVLRAWTDHHGTFTEQWRIETPGGSKLFLSTPRELHIATSNHVEKLEDEVADLKVEYAAEDYTIVFTLDGREVARVNFPIHSSEE